MPSVRSLAALAASLVAIAASPIIKRQDAALAPPFLNLAAQLKGKLWFGTASDIPGPEQQNAEYTKILGDPLIFGQLTPANYMKVRLGDDLEKCLADGDW